MDNLVEIFEKPKAKEKYLIAGWQQWADAGAISSGLPQYLIEHTGAEKVGQINPNGFYLFQLPGTHHLLRPEIKLEEGYRKSLDSRKNEFFYADYDKKGLLIFLGDEPHLAVEQYADAFFDAVEQLEIKRIAALGGVYGAMPYDKDREVSCVYSLPQMKAELADYAVKFSDYEGGSTISTYLVDKAEERGIEFLDFYAFVPAYDFSQHSNIVPGIRIENDFKAWYELMRRLTYMFNLKIDLSELGRQSTELTASIDEKIDALEKSMPELNIREHIQELAEEFTETSFMPLDDVWERELGDLFTDSED